MRKHYKTGQQKYSGSKYVDNLAHDNLSNCICEAHKSKEVGGVHWFNAEENGSVSIVN